MDVDCVSTGEPPPPFEEFAEVEFVVGGVLAFAVPEENGASTVTLNVAVAVFALESVALHVTVVVPIANLDPEAGPQDGERFDPSTTSEADTEKVTTAPDASLARVTMSAGSVSSGAVVSTILTRNVPIALFELESVAEQFTVVVPSPKVEPDRGVQVTAREPSTVSRAVGV